MDKFKIGNSCAPTVAYSATMSVEVSDSRNIIAIAMTGNGTLNLAAASKPTLGDEIILKVSSDTTARDLTLGTGFTAPAITGVISKTKVQTFVYDGSSFIPKSAAVQIN